LGDVIRNALIETENNEKDAEGQCHRHFRLVLSKKHGQFRYENQACGRQIYVRNVVGNFVLEEKLHLKARRVLVGDEAE